MNVGMEPEFMLLARRPDGKFGPADVSDALDKPCYDYKGLSRSRVFLEKLVDSLTQVGIDVYQIDHEDGNGQFEINFTYADALTTSDRLILFRMAASEIAHELGSVCTFMSHSSDWRPKLVRLGGSAMASATMSALQMRPLS
jgi:glutamine synthetase